jgi:hypothetical protein
MIQNSPKTRAGLSAWPQALVLVIGLMVFGIVPAAYAQSSTATLSGIVLDPNDAAIPEATVTVVSTETKLRHQVNTDREGRFVVVLLPPDRYSATVQRQGFAILEIKDLILNVNDQRSMQVHLKVGEISESVTVEGASLVQTESAAVSTVVDHQFVENLPLNGRSFGSLLELTPGTVLTRSNKLEAGQFSVNGQRANANYFMVDGVGANAGISGNQALAGTLPAFNILGGLNNLISVNALQEFRVQTSTYAAEFGRMPGAQVSVISKSGTNQFHGDAFDYFRNDALDASDWFANSRGQSKPAMRQNDFGGVIGGPIVRNKTFFFGSYEGLRLRLPQFALSSSPTLAVRNATPAPLRPFVNAFPIPNGKDLGNGFGESFASFSNPTTLDAISFRIDHQLSRKVTLFGRFNYAPSESIQRDCCVLNELNTSQLNSTTLTFGSTQVISSRISNDLRVNYSRNTGRAFSSLDNFGGGVPPQDSILFPPSTSHRESKFDFSLLGVADYIVGTWGSSSQHQLNVVDNFLITTGGHQLKFGIDYRRLSPIAAVLGDNGVEVDVQYQDTNALISNSPAFVAATAVQTRFPLFTNFSAYAEDTWKATPRLTLTYGLRWEVNTPPTDRLGNDAFTVLGLDNPATMTLAPLGTPLWKTTYDNFAPRIGVAYQISQTKGRETVLRGGFGLFYDVGTAPTDDGIQGFTQPYFRSQTFQTFPFDFNQVSIPPINFNPSPPYGALLVFDPNLKLPRTYEWNVAVERSLGSHQTLTASYVGAAGRRLLRKEMLRGPSLPNPNFTRLVVSRNTATSDYDAMQLQFQRRLSRGFQALASYTWSHSIDIASADSAFEVSTTKLDPKIDRGSSDFDVRHSFSAGVTYDLPKVSGSRIFRIVLRDWSVDAIYRARTALPLTVTTSRTLFGVGQTPARADVVAGVPQYLRDSTVAGGWRLNAAAFAVPPVGRQGTSGRNSLRGFPLSQLDFSFRRRFPLREKWNLELRADLFNALNHPNFATPNGSRSDPLFGQSTQMLRSELGGVSPLYQVGGPRSMQLSLKLQF